MKKLRILSANSWGTSLSYGGTESQESLETQVNNFLESLSEQGVSDECISLQFTEVCDDQHEILFVSAYIVWTDDSLNYVDHC